MDTTIIRNKFISLFGNTPILISAPGRINLIGEHTDYNDGFVLPAAIDKKVTFAIASNNSRKFRFYASDIDQHYETKNVQPAPYEFQWTNYLLGVLAQFENEGVELSGVDCVFESDIPIGAGLSSSAALECGFAYGLNKLLNAGFSDYQLVQMAQKAEHEYAGVMCGIMDQYASIFGKKDHVFQLDCRTHEHSYFRFEMKDYIIALVDTKVKHELASSKYNQRRKECETGVRFFKKINPGIQALRDVNLDMLEQYKNDLDPIIYKRCNYVVSENHRVIDACEAIEQHDFHRFGELMCQSHDGLKNQYKVSCKELDILVELTKSLDYVHGARMMGGGFGGCTINLIDRNEATTFQQEINDEYFKKTGIEPDFYFVNPDDGVQMMN